VRTTLVISDLRKPGLNGLELFKKVKTSKPKVRTILSAYNFEEEQLYQKYMKDPVAVILEKILGRFVLELFLTSNSSP
jgi:YesN/AraC family two-component response regulator